MTNPFEADPTDQSVEWAGVVLRLQDGSFLAYEFGEDLRVHLRVSTGQMSREEMLEALANNDMGQLTRRQQVEVTVTGRTAMWLDGMRTARRGNLERLAVDDARARLTQRELPPVP